MACASDSAIRIPGGADASKAARVAVEDQLGEALTDEMLRDLQLVLSEVVNNSVLHGGVDEAGWVDIVLAVDPDRVRCEVSDTGVQGHPVRREPSYEHGGGFGLNIVDEVASRWGVERDGALTVWFELDRVG